MKRQKMFTLKLAKYGFKTRTIEIFQVNENISFQRATTGTNRFESITFS